MVSRRSKTIRSSRRKRINFQNIFMLGIVGFGLLMFVEHSLVKNVKEKHQPQSYEYGFSSMNRPRETALIIDIISVGSKREKELTEAQQKTFGSHPSVRHFHLFTEDDDDEVDCASQVARNDSHTKKPIWAFISSFCRNQRYAPKHDELLKTRNRFARKEYLQQKGDSLVSAGWLCAIKRPAESLYKVLKEFTTTGGNKKRIPDYLFLLDADTYLNMNNILGNRTTKNLSYGTGYLPKTYPPHETLVIAGCRVKERVMEHNFTFPWGGFGTIFTKRAIERFIQPISHSHCENMNTTTTIYDEKNEIFFDFKTKTSLKTMSYRELTDNEFQLLVCSKLKEDRVGEAFLFQSGMSVADLMYKYVTHWKYTKAPTQWPLPSGQPYKPRGFCMHADWVLGYFINHYYLSNHNDDTSNGYYKNNPDHRLLGYDGSEVYAGFLTAANKRAMKQCENDFDRNCDPAKAHICHHVSAIKMQELVSGK